jgi:hypothetical protein
LTVGKRAQALEWKDAAVMEVAEEQAYGVSSDVHVLDDLDIGRDIVGSDAANVTDLVDAPCTRAVAAYVAVRHEGFKTIGPHDV